MLFLGAVLEFLLKAASAAKTGAAAAGKAAASGAAKVAEAAPAAAEVVAETGTKVGAITEKAAVAPLDAAQNALTNPATAPPPAEAAAVSPAVSAAPSPTPTAAPTADIPAPEPVSTNPPDIQAMLAPEFGGPQMTPTRLGTPSPAFGSPTPEGVLPHAGSAPFTGSGFGSTPLGATGSGSAPISTKQLGLFERIDRFVERMKASQPYQLFVSAMDVKNTAESLGGPVEEARISGQPPSAEQAIAPTPPASIPQLQRAETVGGLGLKEGERPLTTNELRGMQSDAILALVSELRTQRRLFG